jgi:hypothetical protein
MSDKEEIKQHEDVQETTLSRPHVLLALNHCLRRPTRVGVTSHFGGSDFLFGPSPSSWELVRGMLESMDHV